MKDLLISVLCATVFGFGLGWVVHGWEQSDDEKTRIEQEAKKKDEQENTAHVASTDFETKRTNNEIRYRTVTVTLKEFVDRPVYLNQCIDDDGLRVLNNQILRRTDPSQLGNVMP